MSVLSQTSKSLEKPLIIELLGRNQFNHQEISQLKDILNALVLKSSNIQQGVEGNQESLIYQIIQGLQSLNQHLSATTTAPKRQVVLKSLHNSINRIFDVFSKGSGEEEQVSFGSSEFERRVLEVIGQYYEDKRTDLCKEVEEFSCSLFRYPDHEELFALLNMYVSKLAKI